MTHSPADSSKVQASPGNMEIIQPLPRGDHTSRAAVFVGPHLPLEMREFPLPALEPHEAIVAIQCATICGSDLHTVKGLRQERCPSILGHEAVGVVVEVAEPPLTDIQGTPLCVGDRVTWSTVVSCGQCDRCQRGLPQKCRSLSKYGHDLAEGRTALCGGLSQYLLLRSGSAVAKLNATIADEVVCPANCATATVACAMRYAAPIQAERILIMGAGMLGLTAAAMAKTLHAADVTVVDPLPERLSMAERFGADHVVQWSTDLATLRQSLLSATGSDRFDALFEFSGATTAVSAVCDACDIGGRVILVGTVMPSPAVAIDPEAMVRRCMSIRGVHNYAAEDLVSAIRFLETAQHQYPFASLVEKTFSLADADAAMSYAAEHRPVRIAVRPTFDGASMNTKNMVDELIGLLEKRGDSQYGGEAVTQLQHALQAATLAEREQASASLIVAALLHDIGHLLHLLPDDAPEKGVDDQHESIAGQFLAQRFDASVTAPVLLHVTAKRYLCAVENGYLQQLSAPSLLSLKLQGGPMTSDEVAVFRGHPHAEDAIRLRRWDDAAKDPSFITPPLSHFARYLQEVLREPDSQ